MGAARFDHRRDGPVRTTRPAQPPTEGVGATGEEPPTHGPAGPIHGPAAAAAEHPPADDAGFAAWLAYRAGALLLDLRENLGFGDPTALRAAGDRQSHELMAAAFQRWRPTDAVLSEEGLDDPARLSAERVWIVDPLDGTREFGEPGRTDWAVHVALWCRGRGLTAGAVALPAEGEVLCSDPAYRIPAGVAVPTATGTSSPAGTTRPAGTAGSGSTASPAVGDGTTTRLRIVTSRTRPPEFLPALARQLDAELVPMGSAGAKACAVVRGTADAYVHAGGQYEWDSAAPVVVALATGHYASRLDGSTLEYNRADPSLPDLVVCRPEFAPRLRDALRDMSNPT